MPRSSNDPHYGPAGSGGCQFRVSQNRLCTCKNLRKLASQNHTSTMRVLGGRLGGPVPNMTFIGICPSTIEVDWTYDRCVFFRLSPCDYDIV